MTSSGIISKKFFSVYFFISVFISIFISTALYSQTSSDSTKFERDTYLKTEDANVLTEGDVQGELKLIELHESLKNKGYANITTFSMRSGFLEDFQINGGFKLEMIKHRRGLLEFEGVTEVFLNVQYNFLKETKYFPVASVQGGVRQSINSDKMRNSFFGKLLLTKSLGNAKFHFNIKYETNPDLLSDRDKWTIVRQENNLIYSTQIIKRFYRFSYGLGFEIPVNKNSKFMTEIYRESKSLYMINSGLNIRLSKELALNTGIGFQIGSSRYSNFMFTAGMTW